jgi:8-oxo-dGTP pyrophosphatase MutT (NUDIX family)
MSAPAPARFRPSVTVAAVIECDGRFLLVQEQTADGVRLNQPAGHLDPDETLPAACAREVLEETAYVFKPTALLGAYLARYQPQNLPQNQPQSQPQNQPQNQPNNHSTTHAAITYLRFAFTGELGAQITGRALDDGILGTLWLTREEIAARADEHRTPLVMQCIDDYLSGRRLPLDALVAHPSALGLQPAAPPSPPDAVEMQA